MKKLLLVFGALVLSMTMFAQTGTGWQSVRKKQNFKDSVYFQQPVTFNENVSFADSVEASSIAPLLTDTTYHIVFGLGSGQTADTAVFAANAKCGSWKNNSSDTLVAVSLWGIIDSALVDASVTVQISWADTLNAVVPTNLNSSPFTISNEAVGNTDTSFANSKIPPGAIVKGTIGAVTLGAKPSYLQFQLDCYKLRGYGR